MKLSWAERQILIEESEAEMQIIEFQKLRNNFQSESDRILEIGWLMSEVSEFDRQKKNSTSQQWQVDGLAHKIMSLA